MLRDHVNSITDMLHNTKEYCLNKQQQYQQLHDEETLLAEMRWGNSKSVLYAKKLWKHTLSMFLCSYTWIGCTAAFIISFELTPNLMTLSLMIWCFSMALCLQLSNLRQRIVA
jgi:hypothetical protein